MFNQAQKNFSDIMSDNISKVQFIQSLLSDYEAQTKNEKIALHHIGRAADLNKILEKLENQLVELVNPLEEI